MDFQFLLPFIEYHILVESTCFLRLLSPDYWGGEKPLEQMRESVTPYRKPASTSARPPQTRARARDVFLRGVFQIRSSPSEA